jgi:hypothetical protein
MSKFRIPASSDLPVEPRPTSTEDFASRAPMVRSQAGNRPPKPIRVNFDLTPDQHLQLKMRATEERISIADFMRRLIGRELGWKSDGT